MIKRHLKLKDTIRDFRFFLTSKIVRFLPTFNTRGKTVLIIAPHPDDEVLGCGGLINRLCENGNPPYIAILTHGEASHAGCCLIDSTELGIKRIELARNADSILGVPLDNIKILNYKDGAVPQHDEGGALCQYIKLIKPEIVLIPHWGEGWLDHVNVASLISDYIDNNMEVYEYCVWSWYYVMWAGNFGLAKLSWDKANVIKLNKEERTIKESALKEYLTPIADCGKPYSGVLPSQLIKSGNSDIELYFKRH